MQVLAVIVVFSSLATVAVLLRLYTRFLIVRTPGLDDFTIVASLIANWAFSGLALVELHEGLGHHASKLTPAEVQAQLKTLWLVIPLYNLSLILTKVSILILYLRLFPHYWFTVSLRVVMGVVVVFGAWTIFSAFFFCTPVSAFWTESIPDAKCLPKAPVWLFNASMNITTDLAILLLPMPVVTKLHLPWRQKLAVIFIFGVGVFVCITSIIRITTLISLLESRHFSVKNAATTAWSSIESNVAILCACLPTLRPFLLRISSYFSFSCPSRDDDDGPYSLSPHKHAHALNKHLPFRYVASRPIYQGDASVSYSASVSAAPRSSSRAYDALGSATGDDGDRDLDGDFDEDLAAYPLRNQSPAAAAATAAATAAADTPARGITVVQELHLEREPRLPDQAG